MEGAFFLRSDPVKSDHPLTLSCCHQLEQCPEYYLSLADVKQRLYANEIAHAEG